MLFPESFKEKSVLLNLSQEGIRRPSTKIFSLHHSPTVSNKKVLVLLHGYPQNHTLYYDFVRELSVLGILDEWDIVIPDLPGYGRSTKIPSADGSHLANSKRAVAADIVSLINALFGTKQQFVVAGHDRGARVAYRLAKDHRDRVLGTCIMEIVPTKKVFERMNYSDKHRMTFGTYHWIFLALPSPLPETLIGASSDFYYSHTIESWTGPRSRGNFDPIAVASWVEQYRNPAVITGALEDYRAGASIDLEHDEEDERDGTAAVDCPLLVLHSVGFGEKNDVKGIWEPLAAPGKIQIRSVGDDQVGHFIPVEAAQETVAELVPWLKTLDFGSKS
ncbi:hypothetical protein D9758_006302 [Tetrapyrgos nigripes]|uniref:AB hydrolase-1 domain-containing protein n=1 Tax=Tetrapyrgos nigripes TaxID=182062 RepID=A0A8H5DAZ1_9AGAR|nr:hypothetical protein D9758_006302 [Tetrapyrgos nigripes]